jgi:hypothetical protein
MRTAGGLQSIPKGDDPASRTYGGNPCDRRWRGDAKLLVQEGLPDRRARSSANENFHVRYTVTSAQLEKNGCGS